MKEVKNNLIYSVIGIVLANIVIYIVTTTTSSNSTVISPLAKATYSTPIPTPTPTKVLSKLPLLVQEYFPDHDNIGIVIKNLKTKEEYTLNEHKQFEPASLYKLWIMAETMDQIHSGTLTETQTISDSVANLNTAFNIDPELAELTEGQVSFTVNDALKQMITISHNYAALLLGKTVRLKTVQQFLEDNNFNESELGEPPQTTPDNIALFFEKLYSENLIDPESSKKMIELLKDQKLNNKIPKYLPSSTVIAHKTGELGTYSHDAGIIYTPKGDYILVIMTDSQTPTKTEDIIGLFSKAVFKYFSQ